MVLHVSSSRLLRISGTAAVQPFLVAGGVRTFPTSELYDPTAGAFVDTGGLLLDISSATATLLNNGQVLVAGGNLIPSGVNLIQTPTQEVQLYDPGSGTFSFANGMWEPRAGHTATLLANGKVLIAGANSQGNITAELYDPSASAFTCPDGSIPGPQGCPAAASLINPRSAGLTATLLGGAQAGKVLITGGIGGGGNAIAAAEV